MIRFPSIFDDVDFLGERKDHPSTTELESISGEVSKIVVDAMRRLKLIGFNRSQKVELSSPRGDRSLMISPPTRRLYDEVFFRNIETLLAERFLDWRIVLENSNQKDAITIYSGAILIGERSCEFQFEDEDVREALSNELAAEDSVQGSQWRQLWFAENELKTRRAKLPFIISLFDDYRGKKTPVVLLAHSVDSYIEGLSPSIEWAVDDYQCKDHKIRLTYKNPDFNVSFVVLSELVESDIIIHLECDVRSDDVLCRLVDWNNVVTLKALRQLYPTILPRI